MFVQVSLGQTPWPRSHKEGAMYSFSPPYQFSQLPSRAKGLRIQVLPLCHPASFRRGITAMKDPGQLHFLPQSRSTSLNLSLRTSAAQLGSFRMSCGKATGGQAVSKCWPTAHGSGEGVGFCAGSLHLTVFSPAAASGPMSMALSETARWVKVPQMPAETGHRTARPQQETLRC